MAQPKALLDTDTLSAILRGTPVVAARSRDYLAEHRAFALSIITSFTSTTGSGRSRARPNPRPPIADYSH